MYGAPAHGMISRRAALFAGLGLALAACGRDAPSAGTWTQGSFVSRYRGGARTGWTVLYPPGHDRARLPVLVVLHGRGGDHTQTYSSLHLDQHLAHVVKGGTRPFAIAAVDGGDHEYWHPRRGTDPAGMVIHEFLPLLAAHGLKTTRVGLLGWSMGGYGALYLATVLGTRRCAVSVAESPAIWHHSWQSVEGAFDNAADFDRHAIFGRQALLRDIALRIDCGASDGFAPVTRDLRASISPNPGGGIEPGGHDPAYWRSQAPAQLRFVGRHLAYSAA
jgi:enterochelin esterase-like enzyme